jgi:GGDEF domain-containing protein
MPHEDQNETHRSHRSLAALHIVKEHRGRARSSREDVTAQCASEDHLRQLAATDALTGLANYRKLSEILESEIKRSQRTARIFAVLLFDLKGLKRINDSHGHLMGNWALCSVADIFHFSCRSIDTAATNLQLFCRKPALMKPTPSAAAFANGCPTIARSLCFQ